jgi:predicted metal-dependent HD superfamily phosphohydrolase
MAPRNSEIGFERWRETAASLGFFDTQAEAIYAVLMECYTESHRAYHNLSHLTRMMDTLTPFQQTAQDYAALCLATWFHDAVYDTRRSDNEEQSAVLMRQVLIPILSVPLLDRIQILILATKTHQAASGDNDCQLFLDADLSILGSNPHDYSLYAQAIRQEYAWVSDADYCTGRTRVLEHFLAQSQIYGTDALFSALEQPARDNLRWEIEQLQ